MEPPDLRSIPCWPEFDVFDISWFFFFNSSFFCVCFLCGKDAEPHPSRPGRSTRSRPAPNPMRETTLSTFIVFIYIYFSRSLLDCFVFYSSLSTACVILGPPLPSPYSADVVPSGGCVCVCF